MTVPFGAINPPQAHAGAATFVAAPAWACGGLIAPNGTVNLVRTTTLAGYHDGVEHYVTSFEYAGGGGRFGSIVPLPGIPSDVVRGGDWTLQRLVQEVQPPQVEAFRATADLSAANAGAEVILETRIDALDITVLKGGAADVGQWALDHGFQLPPDAPEVLEFYASRSPIFMAARFDASEAERLGQGIGDGTPIHLSIPTQNPWVPLRILSLGREASETVEADVFLLTDARPALLPRPGATMTLERSEPASDALLDDLRSDKGMGWIPESGMWLSYLKIDARAEALDHDLAIDPTGLGTPSKVAAGLVLPEDVQGGARTGWAGLWAWVGAAALVVATVAFGNRILDDR
ncbi:MAG TPA: DUF2330 domain-containing protein [Actinomycetota bacterium]|nr:DUF2330 domain-containing protein [Actinomycetota bacterium]